MDIKNYLREKYAQELAQLESEQANKAKEFEGEKGRNSIERMFNAIGDIYQQKDVAEGLAKSRGMEREQEQALLNNYLRKKAGLDAGLSREQLFQQEDERLKNQQAEEAQLPEQNALAQDLASKMGYPKERLPSLTAKSFKEFSPAYMKMYEIAENAKNRRFEKALEKQAKSEKEAKLSDKQVADISSYDKALQAIDDVLAQKQNFDTGKLSMGMNKLAGMVGLDDPKKSAFKSDVGEQLATYIKGISGATVSPTERAALLQNVPSVYDNDEVFVAKANALKRRLGKTREVELANLEKQGKAVQEFQKAPVENIEAMDKLKVVNGKRYKKVPGGWEEVR